MGVLLVAMVALLIVMLVQHVQLWRALFGLRRTVDQGLKGLEHRFDDLSLVFSDLHETPTAHQIERAQYGLIDLMGQLENYQKAV